MHRNPNPHTWMHRNRHSSGKWTEILLLTHECTEIIIPQVNTPELYPQHMNAPKSSSLRSPKSSSLKQMPRNLTPHTWMHRNRHSSCKCTGILPLTHEFTEIVTPQVNAPEILPLTHECTEIVTLKVNAPKFYASHMNAPTSSFLR